MALFTCVWIIILALILCVGTMIINQYPDVTIIRWAAFIVLLAWLMVYVLMVHYFKVLSQPVKTEKATVIAKLRYGRSSSITKTYTLKLKAEDGNEFGVIVPYKIYNKVYKALEKGDKVLVKHQGTELIDMKKIVDKSIK